MEKFKFDDLQKREQELVKEAHQALGHAYAPYSKFHVGAAVRLEDGTICQGSNQENASYPLCMCAERTAMYHAISRFPDQQFFSLAIICQNQNKTLHKIGSPCGACRQVILEYETRFGKPIKVFMAKDDLSEVLVIDSIKEILPLSFDGSML